MQCEKRRSAWNMANILEELQPLFRDILDQPNLRITRESNSSNVEGWDSLAHINLVTAIEQEYDIKFSIDELLELKNVGEMVDLMEIKLATK
jgi:acyl carrier protein